MEIFKQINKKDSASTFKPSEGELFLEDFFKENEIKFQVQKKLILRNDPKSYRLADFYLPQFDIYVEFFGLWNKQVKDEDYREKKKIYHENEIPCIYVYPENLGIIDFIFEKRIKEVLDYYKREDSLKKYKNYKMKRWVKENFIERSFYFFGALIWLLYELTSNNQENNKNYTEEIITISIIIVQLFKIANVYISIYMKNTYPLKKFNIY